MHTKVFKERITVYSPPLRWFCSCVISRRKSWDECHRDQHNGGILYTIALHCLWWSNRIVVQLHASHLFLCSIHQIRGTLVGQSIGSISWIRAWLSTATGKDKYRGKRDWKGLTQKITLLVENTLDKHYSNSIAITLKLPITSTGKAILKQK